MSIRDANPEDAALLCEAEQFHAKTPGQLASHPDELKVDAFKSKISSLLGSENGKYIVAVIDERIVGHAMLDPLPLKSTAHNVQLTLVTHLGWQGKGIGRTMLAHLIEWAQKNPKVERIELRVRSANTNAIKLYENLGFKEEGRFQKRIKTPQGYLDDISMALFVKYVP